MKTKDVIETDPCGPRSRKAKLGYSMLEVLMAVAVLSCVLAGAYFVITSTNEVTRGSKLRSDTVAINNAIRTYLVHGGRIPSAASGSDVITRLKSIADQPSSARMAGLRGAMVDARLRGITATESGKERAVWNGSKMRFEIQTSGPGFSAFDLSDDPTALPEEESRKGMLSFASKEKWVWDGAEGGAGRPGTRSILTTDVAQPEPPAPAAITKLAPPDVSMPGALYDLSAFNPTLDVTLTDVNAPGAGRVYYSIDGGPWIEYGGTPLHIPSNLTTKLRTFAAAVNGEFYEDSDMRTETYETIYFTGRTRGLFHTPIGDLSLLTNLVASLKLPIFNWGLPTKGSRQNSLTFTGDSFERIAPDQEFKLGTLSYYNGTTHTGTNATSVQFKIDLDLTIPGVNESLNYTLKLLSTSNLGKDPDVDADYVWIPEVATSFQTIIKGKRFALFLRFGEHSKNGFTTIDTFHAHEDKTLTGTIYGRLSEMR